ncbi:hypothetical protein SS50377_20402 [Spironucleus salmonicida]|uniref:Uncharacterized protein n=1 Tax=Spironucleus salmonicida TaxID=348837 RepID=V6LUA3_9EUKA|nr:hypothetical protein SS50377_20402 [Spironucleus salmonicida]|eukprot:EST48197.1 Hypothetical protein SS50377_11635 [Spironucleus salmonicida]
MNIHNGLEVKRIKAIDVMNGVYNGQQININNSQYQQQKLQTQNKTVDQNINYVPQQGKQINIPFIQQVHNPVQVLPQEQQYVNCQQKPYKQKCEYTIPLINIQPVDQKQYKNPVFLHSNMPEKQDLQSNNYFRYQPYKNIQLQPQIRQNISQTSYNYNQPGIPYLQQNARQMPLVLPQQQYYQPDLQHQGLNASKMFVPNQPIQYQATDYFVPLIQ